MGSHLLLLSKGDHHVSLQGTIAAVSGPKTAVFELLGHGENGAAVMYAAVLTSAESVRGEMTVSIVV